MGRGNVSPAAPAHTPGTAKGEEQSLNKGKEPGRDKPHIAPRTARDSTGINADDKAPIDPRMPYFPPA